MPWIHVFVDGAARGNPGPAGLGVVFRAQNGDILTSLHSYIGQTTNNVAEYKALLAALEEAQRLGFQQLKIHTDSQLMQRQLAGHYRVKSKRLKTLFQRVKRLLNQLRGYDILHVPREENREADRLANLAIDEAIAN